MNTAIDSLDIQAIAQSDELFSYVLASYCPLDEMDTEADLIVNDDAMKFLEVQGFNGTIRDLIKAQTELMSKPNVRDVLIVHIGTIHKLYVAMTEGKA